MSAWLAASAALGALDEREAREFFEREVRPALAEHCWRCHGPDKQSAGLRLDSREAILRGGESGPEMVPGQAGASRLVAAVRQDGDLQMPPDGKLSARAIEALARWVQDGAAWPATRGAPASDRRVEVRRTHWAFQPVRPQTLPNVKDTAWPRTPIDRFVLVELESRGLAPSPPADRRTLARRVSLDLIGLLPAPDEVEAFVRDDSSDAYPRWVDRLLASPHYGEQWGRHWLDVARYSDTKGYVYAREERFWVHAWVYRDWVVRALNEDLSYDRFLRLQIAADQLAQDDPSSLAALGFLTLGRRFLGVSHDIIDDRIDVVARGTMALTVGCARCHDHKYDPIPAQDYYSLYGVFQSCAERLVPIATAPGGETPSAAFATGLRERERKLAEALATRRAEASARARSRAGEYLAAQLQLQAFPEEGFDELLSTADLIPAFARRWHAYLDRAARQGDTLFAPWHAYAQLSDAEFSQRSPDVTHQLAERMPGALPAGSPSARDMNPLVAACFQTPPASMREVAQRYAALLAEIDRRWQAIQEQARQESRQPPAALPDEAAEAIRQVLHGPDSPCMVPEESIVNVERFFDTPTCEELWKLQGEVDRWLIRSADAPPYATILVDRREPAEPQVFKRGNPANKGERVPRQFLGLLVGPNRQPFQHGSGRLELAEAITDPRNPLTARVMVNRVWMHHFGSGLVRTPSDFGTRAEPPSHPALLDWLAGRFVEDGWSLKKLHRLILLSACYQQSSSGPNDALTRERAHHIDPGNRLLWRTNVHRLSWEELRDAMLAASEDLVPRIGGKPADLFTPPLSRRRTLYGLVDRQFLPNTLRTFDFANPDLHIPLRSETTVAQQALFFLNHAFVAERAKSLVQRPEIVCAATPEERVRRLYRLVYQRLPTASQMEATLQLVRAAEQEVSVDAGSVPANWLGPWEQLAQVLLASNEFVFVD